MAFLPECDNIVVRDGNDVVALGAEHHLVDHHILPLLHLAVQLKLRPGQATNWKKLGGQVGVGGGLQHTWDQNMHQEKKN